MSNRLLQRGTSRFDRDLLRSLVVAGVLALSLAGAAIAAALFADGFESGDITAWSTSDDSGATASLAVSAAAAIGPGGSACGGSPCGLAVTVSSGTDHAWVADQTPNAESAYYASFRLDPNSVGGNFAMSILTGDEVDTPPSAPSFIVRLVGAAGSYSFEAAVRSDAGGYSGNQSGPVTDGPMFVEVAWAASSGPGSNDGFVRVIVDGSVAASLTGIDNDTRRVEAARLGAVRDGGSNAASGTYFLDDFSSFDDVPADLAMQKTGIESTPGTVVFSLTVTNDGPGDATGVVVTDPLPAELQYLSDDCGGSNLPPWTWDIGTLGNGSVTTCQITLAVLEAGPVENTATVSGDQSDTEGDNQSATATLVVSGLESVSEIPTLTGAGVLLLGALLSGAALWSLRRGV